jgi:3'(2'), 5'-bisphosphate nucleotidase
VILDGLARLLPGLPVIAEESVGRQSPPALGDTFVLVDPLDGTKEFIAGRDEYTVNVALVSGRTPIAGIIAAPARRLLWRGVVGHGAERLAIAGETVGAPKRIHVRQWRSSGAVALVSRSHRDAATEALLDRLPPTRAESCGSSLKFCRLAEGSADIYPRLGPTSEWDIAAGHALVVAAGGMVTAPDGRPLAYGNAQQRFRVPGFIAWGDSEVDLRVRFEGGAVALIEEAPHCAVRAQFNLGTAGFSLRLGKIRDRIEAADRKSRRRIEHQRRRGSAHEQPAEHDEEKHPRGLFPPPCCSHSLP